ncbi:MULTISPECIES: hypothetical protein [unclassified Marinovum]
MKLTRFAVCVTLSAMLTAPVAVVAQDAYGEKGWVEPVDAKSYVPEQNHYVAPRRETRVYVQQTHVVRSSTHGCVMGMGVMQRGTLLCPGH